MKNYLHKIIISTFALPFIAHTHNCATKITGYHLVKNTVYPFILDKTNACFFAFYTTDPEVDPITTGYGNLNKNKLWYGYYKTNNPSKIYEFPKPSDSLWNSVCHINAVSFLDVNNDNVRDVTVIGSCEKYDNINYRYPFVFIRQGNKYIFNEDVYTNLYGFIDLTVADVIAYIKNPGKIYPILRARYKRPNINNE